MNAYDRRQFTEIRTAALRVLKQLEFIEQPWRAESDRSLRFVIISGEAERMLKRSRLSARRLRNRRETEPA